MESKLGWTKALPSPTWKRHPILRYKSSIRFLFGRQSETHYVRLFPNFGFMFTLAGYQVTYSRHRGFSSKKV